MVIVTSSCYTTLPPVPEGFVWTEQSWGAALICSPLAAIAPHMFTTRQPQLSSSEQWHRLAVAVGADEVATLTQVHGRTVAVVRSGWPMRGPRPEADVLVSAVGGPALAVRAADCVPLLLADRTRGAVAAVHAGWRGTVARAAVAAVEALAREFGSRPADLVAAIGPSIGSCCYEVGSELVDAFATAGHERYLIDRWFLAPPARRGSRMRPKLYLDLVAATRDQLVLSGVPEVQVHAANLCTAEHLDVLTSCRREGKEAGRLVGLIRART
jgi:hypothetical protein